MANLTTIELLEKLIAFDTTSDRSNLPMIDFIEAYLNKQVVSALRFYDDSGKKANLYATIGPANQRGIILSGHTDTVPVTGQHWTKNPYQLTEQDGLLYGRGTSDMKGFVAAVLAAVPTIVAAKLAIPIHLAFSYDEEVGCIGVRSLIDYLSTQPVLPLGCIIGEPTSMKLTLSHKGKVALRVKVQGKSCHSGMSPFGVNAIHYANRLISFIEKKVTEYAQDSVLDERFQVPYTTMQVGVIKGGEALNIVPEHCIFDFEIRNIPADDPLLFITALKSQAKVVEKEMQAIDQQSQIEFEWLTDYPGLSMSAEEPFVQMIMNTLKNREIEAISFGTEGGLFQSALNIPVVVCGPGSMAQGHQPDEFISVKQLICCDQFLKDLIKNLKDFKAPSLD